MKKIAFYVMNSKGYYVITSFIEKFGSSSIEYIVSSEDSKIQNDFFSEIKALAEREKILFFNRFDDYVQLEKCFSGYKFAIGWRWLIKNDLNLVVFHDSLLPKYRGFAPLVNALINEEKIVGVTALFASSEYDRGDIIAQKQFDIHYPITISDVIQKVQPLYFDLLDDIYVKVQNGDLIDRTQQREDEATYSLWLDDDDYFIDWSWSASKIKRFVDAVGYPYTGAKANLNNKVVKLLNVDVIHNVNIEHRERHIGKVIFMKENTSTVICKKGLLKLEKITDENNKPKKITFRSRFK